MKKYVFFALTGLAALCACENADGVTFHLEKLHVVFCQRMRTFFCVKIHYKLSKIDFLYILI